MSLRDAAKFLDHLVNLERNRFIDFEKVGLARIEALLERVGHPERDLCVIHIAGSKGKGSTALYAEALLRELGESVGCFTSPHLERWTERFRLNGREIEDPALAKVLETLRFEVEALCARGPEFAPSFFDVTTAAALLLFRNAGVDRAILEVGLGGRLDSTNVVTPAVACVTSIELEHVGRLGNSLASIAGEKAGIIKRGRPVVVGALAPEAMSVVCERARILSAPLLALRKDFRAETSLGSNEFVQLTYSFPKGPRPRSLEGDAVQPPVISIPLSTRGPRQGDNAALALTCVDQLGVYAREALAAAVVPAFGALRLPGRMEVVSEYPWIIVDGAHTQASLEALREGLEGLPRRAARFVLSMSADKNLEALLPLLLDEADELIATEANPDRSAAANVLAEIARRLRPELSVHVEPDPRTAIRWGLERTNVDDLLCVTGSVYLAGCARSVLRELGCLKE